MAALSGSAYKRLHRELAQLQQSPPEGVRVSVDESDISSISGWIQGPPHTPYENGYFKIRFQFGSDFPNAPPKCSFATKIFHPNVAPATGEICVSTLKKDWKKEYGVGHILITVKCLLIHPNPESALHEEAGKLLLEAYDDYARHARLMTDVHARHRPAEFDVPSSSEASSSYQQTVPTAVQSVPTARSLATSLTPVIALQSNHSPVDVAMAVDYPEKPHHSANQATTVIPKKRSAPTSSTSATTPASGQQFYAQPSLHQPSTVLGLASHTSGNNAIRPKPQAALTGTGVSSNPQKKRGLKRL